MDTVSIIVPVYNTKQYIDECLNSITTQTYKNLEIIVVNDWSTDWSWELCDHWARKDNRIKIIHKKNGWLSDARNAWLDIAKWKYISFIDSDDIVTNNFIEELYKTIKKTKSDFVSCLFFTFNDDEINFPKSLVIPKVKIYWKENYLDIQDSETSCTKLYSIDVFKKLRFKIGVAREDSWIYPHIVESSKRISVIYEKYYWYRQRQESITHTLTKEKIKSRLDCFIHREAFYKNINNQKQAELAQVKKYMTENELYTYFWEGRFIDANKRLFSIVLSEHTALISKLYRIKQLYLPFISFQKVKTKIIQT